jgi:chemotaxis protein CheC
MKSLNAERLDALQEFMNIGVGRAASTLTEMVDSRILLQIPVVRVYQAKELRTELVKQFDSQKFSAVKLDFSGSLSGSAELVFPTESAAALVSVLTGEDINSPDLDAVKIGTLSEIGNITINGVMGSISNLLRHQMNYKLPTYLENTIEDLLLSDYPVTDETVFLLAQARFTIEQMEITGDIILIFEMRSFDVLLEAIDRELEVSG